ncbi:MAG TPA: ABC transporter permease [Bryobacteraceae bacterium]|jgi:putative ABC transport system permease protein|nr:ABC transporter permease [Bryobacteraceae bacterium]
MLVRLRSWWRATRHAGLAESEMDAELRAHIDAHAERLTASGVDPAEARRRAMLDFGPVAYAKEACRDARGANFLPALLQDLAFGLRMLRKSPGFAALAVVTLAIGIGATTAVFSLVDGVLLRALPYRDPGRLVYLFQPIPHITGVPLEGWGPMNADFYDWQSQNHSFASLALFTSDSDNLSVDGGAVRVNSSRVTGDFFRTLGVEPALGRALGPDDDRSGVERVVVISHALWQSQFGADPHVLGRQVLLDAKPCRIVGVMPPSFAFPHGAESLETAQASQKTTAMWVPYALTPQQKTARDDGSGNAIGRLKPGVTVARAQSEIAAITAGFDKLHPPIFQGAQVAIRSFDIEIAGGSRRVLMIFLAAVFLLLLIASSNIASLVLARMHGRSREFSLRTALGASRARLIRQLSTESLCLAGAGGVLGIVSAWLTVRLLVHIHPANIPRLEETTINARVLLFALGVSLSTVLFCGLFPAWSASRCEINDVLKRASRAVRGSTAGLHRGLAIGQVALTFVLLAGAGLLIRSFLNLQAIDKGFHPASTVSLDIRLDGRYNSPERQVAFYRQLIDRTAKLPGVEAVAASTNLPLGGGESISTIEVEGFPYSDSTFFEQRNVSPGYFAAEGIPIVEGRAFTDADTANAQPVAIVSRSFARKYYPGQSALGRRIHTSGHRVIVGVVGDVRQYSLETTPPMQFYLPFYQLGEGSAHMVARTHLPPAQLASGMRTLVRNLDPAIAVAGVRTGADLVAAATAERRFETFLLTTFAGIALFLSLVGLYALMTYSVEQRTAEIGVRMALGAQPAGVMRLILRQGSTLALAGIALGFAAAWFATQALATLLFEVRPADVPTFLLVALLFTVVSLAACYFPARRATKVDPMISLRAE